MKHIEEIYQVFKQSTGVCTDTRKVGTNQLFIALKGDRFDGNDFALEALKQGALAALVDRKALATESKCLYVPNTLSTLQKLARYHRDQLKIPIIGITGTNGKTTTKELIASVLSMRFGVRATAGNLNNHIGVPLTLLSMDAQTEIGIVEMGANHPGEIGWLCQIAAPGLGVVTNVGRGHLEGFGSLANIWETKMALYRYLDRPDRILFINEAEPSLSPLSKIEFEQAIRFNYQSLPGFVQSVKCSADQYKIKTVIAVPAGEAISCEVQLYGAHNFHNILTAVAFGSYFDIPATEIASGLEKYQSQQNRSQVILRGSNTYFLDAYNANPSSMLLALEFFANLKAANKVIVLGDMMELGDESAEAHLEIVHAVEHITDLVWAIFVGHRFALALNTLGCSQNMISVENAVEARHFLQQSEVTQMHILLKGSRSMRLETIL